MNIPVSDAKAQLTELVRRAEAGEEIILTRFGHAVVQLTPLREKTRLTPRERLAIMNDISMAASADMLPGPDAAHSQDFLYDENGLPA
jgi:prevent-host-death family protein